MTIEFLQSKEQRNIKDKLKQSIKECNSLKAAVAFWNIDINYLKELADKLSRDDSFVCVDIHQPTDIDCLKEFVEKDSNIYLFLYRVETGRHPLLHTKLLLFDLPDGKAEIWIGSQNFTHSALTGSNLESTSIITTTKGSPLYKDVFSYLDFIKDCCEDIGTKVYPEIGGQFNIEFLDFYKKLQQSFDFQEENKPVIDLVCEDIEDICSIAKHKHKDNFILIASFDENDSSKFLVGKEILIRALDKEGEIVCYQSEVYFAGKITPIGENEENKNSFVTTYTDSHNKRYEIKSYIVRHEAKIPVFISSTPYYITNQSFSVIIKIIKEFKKDLSYSQKGNFWRKVCSDDLSKELTYLKPIKNLKYLKDKKVQLPQSPDTVKGKSNSFDKLFYTEKERRKKVIEFLYNEYDLRTDKNQADDGDQRIDFQDFHDLLKQKRIITYMVIKKDEDKKQKQYDFW